MNPVHLIPMREDNYTFAIQSKLSPKKVLIIDPSTEKIVDEIKRRKWTVVGIFNTHHHYDHVGGNQELASKWECPVYGADLDREQIPALSHSLKDGDKIEIAGWKIRVLATPGHTLGALCFIFDEIKAVFVGDTMFAMGCGRLFEGSPQQMLESLLKIGSLPEDYKIYCGHEYTEQNVRFALSVESSSFLKKYAEGIKNIRRAQRPTIPTQVSDEWQGNPFLRVTLPSKHCTDDAVKNFTLLRERKDVF
ncbi:MAG: hydroxyacylglutathione hydrolase [Oligoflexales bacterium]